MPAHPSATPDYKTPSTPQTAKTAAQAPPLDPSIHSAVDTAIYQKPADKRTTGATDAPVPLSARRLF